MKPVAEIQRLNRRIAFWQCYEPAVKADLCAHAFLTPQGWVLIDPIPLREEPLAELRREADIAAIILTNANHERAAEDFRQNTGVPIYAHAAAKGETTIEVNHWIQDEAQTFGFTAIHLPGFAAGEIALHSTDGQGTMMMGDALINLEPHGFAMLPDKYCGNPKVARKSLQKLLQFSFEVMTFAHGLPVISGARQRLEQLLQ
jgi:glyoxylase-like metal-dependent hydrolase (beta-lactamase superfamily II)